MASYKDFYDKHKELQRLRKIYKQRVDRAKTQGLYNTTYLSKINNYDRGLDKEGNDDFSLDAFLTANEERQEQMLRKITARTAALEDKLANKMSSVRGVKEMIKRDLELKHYPTSKDMSSTVVKAKLGEFSSDIDSAFKHAKVAEIMDEIDRLPLTELEKETLKKYIRRRLNAKERSDYDDQIFELDFNIDEILEEPKYFLQELKQEIPEEELAILKEAASKLTLSNGDVRW